MFHYMAEGKTGMRAWWHINHRVVFKVEFYWWHTFCHASVDVDDEGWSWSLAFPPFAIFIGFDGFPSWKPQEKHIFTWDHNREVWLTDQRECKVSIHDWTIRFIPWGRSMEWRTADPWWVRGVSLNLPDLLLGKTRYQTVTLKAGIPVKVPMPEGVYAGTAKIERATWKRPLWFARHRVSTWIDVPKGVPFQGKGENSWDCGDDGLFGCGVSGESVERAVGHYVESVLTSRRRYGMPSDKAIQEALA
jgi:hypothetical protein